ncbi:hypothetical protein F511_34735 [Dorcoceras hygrometricum]|uniref:Uncharacterized protein n=1 Tax=Dorcoceras hygrometricum TaxID=472368 RepID=A0A2Z7D0F7_9LAMI|nr:hypothetical protein F511_34735 [Dorcoceras hygrometricum]
MHIIRKQHISIQSSCHYATSTDLTRHRNYRLLKIATSLVTCNTAGTSLELKSKSSRTLGSSFTKKFDQHCYFAFLSSADSGHLTGINRKSYSRRAQRHQSRSKQRREIDGNLSEKGSNEQFLVLTRSLRMIVFLSATKIRFLISTTQSTSTDSRLFFTTADIPLNEETVVDQLVLPATALPANELISKIDNIEKAFAEARTQQDQVFRDLIKSVKQEVRLQKAALSLEMLEFKKGVWAHSAIVVMPKRVNGSSSGPQPPPDDRGRPGSGGGGSRYGGGSRSGSSSKRYYKSGGSHKGSGRGMGYWLGENKQSFSVFSSLYKSFALCFLLNI